MLHRDRANTRVFRSDLPFTGVKVFAASFFDERARLGDRITEWIAANPHRTVTEIVVTQSSDSTYHCLTITVLFSEPLSLGNPDGR